MRIIYFSIFIMWVGALSIIYIEGKSNVEDSLISSLKDNEREVSQLLEIAIAYNESTKEQLIANLLLNFENKVHPLTSQLNDYPEIASYGLEGNETINGEPYKANLTGIGSLSEVTIETLHEINAALALNLSTAVENKNTQFLWAYYTSKNGFMLLAPRVGIKDFYFSEYIYSKPFWSVATPENNPTNETVISELYLDAAGKGLMISISTPVYFKDEFKGVVSLDVGLDYLSDVLYSYNSSLNNYASIITKNGVVAANKENIGINEEAIKLDKNTKNYKLTKKTDGYYMLSNLINGRFYLIYQLADADFTRLLIKSIYGIQIILTLFIIILVLLLNLTKNLINTKKMAESDGLSQMYNRMTLEKISNEIVDHAQKNDEPVSIIMADIDLFKNLNDQYGHHVGDAGIIHVASMIKQAIRKADIVGRYGGEEFVVTMPNTNIETAKLVAERIRQNIEKSEFYNGNKVTVSIGVAEGQDLSAQSFHALCQKADLALYQAKKTGRNCTVKYSPDLENLTSKH